MTVKPLFPALTRTKLYRPPLPADWVPRPHLLERLGQQRQRTLTLVSAPAGFGKSTLLAAWLERCDWRSAWLSLDGGDNDLATFLFYTVSAVRTLYPEFGTDTQALLNVVSLPPLSVIASSFSNELDEIDEPFLLVLDDYHVIHNPAIHDLLTELLNHPPRPLHLVLAVRHDPPLSINALRARAAVSEIRSHDLRFSLEEAIAFLRHALDPEIDESQAAFFNEKTEGWIAGLRLAALSAWHNNGTARLATLDSKDVYLMEYLASVVLAQQPTALQEFLAKTSILDRLHGALCEAVAQQSDLAAPGQTYLAWLEELDLFVVPLDEQREWFRYHQLFRQLLQHQLERRYRRDEIAELHRRAGRWFAAHGLLEEAVQHALLADDAAEAAQIVAQQRHVLINQDEWRHLEVLLQVLPRAIVETQPELLLARAWCAHNRYNLPQMPALIDQAETLIAQQSLEPAVTRGLRGEVATFRSYQAFHANDMPRAVSQAQQALADLPPEWWHARLVARLYLTCAYHVLGDPVNAAAALATGFDEAQANGPYLMRSLIITCFVYWLAGDLQGVADAASQMLILGEHHHYPQTANWAHYFRGIVHFQRNNLTEAEQDLSAVVLDRYQTHLQCLIHSAMALALTYQAQQRPAEALTVAAMLPAFLYETGNTVLLPMIHAFQADLALRQSRLAEANQWAVQTQPAALRAMPFFFVQPLVLPKVLLALNTPDSRAAAAEQLARLSEFVEAQQHTHVLIEVLAVQAMLFEAQGDRAAALESLTRAIGLAQPGGFIRLFVDLGSTMQSLLRELRDRGVAPYFVARILAAFVEPQPIEPATTFKPPELIEPLTRRELEVLALLEQRLSNKEIAARLFITPSTAKLHTLHIYQKLQVNTRRDAVAKAQTLSLLAGQ
jgi:LuxR family transcriptional regulator, maltose regulon positive regulatory protein